MSRAVRWPDVGAAPWALAQSWHDLLFAHWAVPAAPLAALLPAGLELDTFDGEAWLGVVPFRMADVRLRRLPPLPAARAFEELNLRTYVRRGDTPGVWFFSLDAASRLAVQGARVWFGLPYFHAAMECRPEGDGVRYRSRRDHRGAPAAELEASYRPVGPVSPTAPGTLEHWLTERYVLFADHPLRGLLSARVHHDPWPLQPAEAELRTLDMTRLVDLELQGEPLLHFSRALGVFAEAPRRVPGA